MSNEPHTTPLLSEEWLHALVSELDNENIIGIILGGSHVRGEATAYSDVDIVCFISDSAPLPRKRFIYRDGHLVNIGVKTVTAVRHDFTRPENAYIMVPAMRQIRILLDKAVAGRWLLLERVDYARHLFKCGTRSLHKSLSHPVEWSIAVQQGIGH
jgi:predicted nucleotidyltransferase